MSADAITRLERAILSVLQPLTGERGEGVATVYASSSAVLLPRNTYAIPRVVSVGALGQIDPTAMVKSAEETLCSAGGTPVEILSVLGGANANLQVGTELYLDPPVAGIARAVVTSALDGGAEADGLGVVKRIVVLEGLGSAAGVDMLFRAEGLSAFPAAVLSWEGAGDVQVMSKSVQQWVHRFRLYVVTSRIDSSRERQDEGKQILHAAAELLVARASVDGEIFSSPPIALASAGRLAVAQSSHIYWLEFAATVTIGRLDTRAFPDWLRTRIDAPTTHAAPKLIVSEAIYPMEQSFGGAFSSEFSRVP